MTHRGTEDPGVPRWRLLLFAGGGLGLLAGLSTGLARAGLSPAVGPPMGHGILMVLGFLGTLIALERAVALRARWSYLGPGLSAAAVVWTLVGLPVVGAGLLFTGAGGVLLLAYGVLLRRRYEPDLALMAAGAVAWVAAAVLWTLGWSPVRLAWLLGGFLVLTIVGERLELSRLRMPGRASQRRLLAAAGLFVLGVVLTVPLPRVGLVLGGVGLLAQTAWFARNDIARVTVRHTGLPRFAATCMLAGYSWLAVAGALWVALGLRVGGPLLVDAALHAMFLGFVLSMVLGHAPIILPAILRVPLPYRPIAWLPLAALHLSVLVRVAADLLGSTWGRSLGAYGNVVALLLFVGVTAGTALRARAAPS